MAYGCGLATVSSKRKIPTLICGGGLITCARFKLRRSHKHPRWATCGRSLGEGSLDGMRDATCCINWLGHTTYNRVRQSSIRQATVSCDIPSGQSTGRKLIPGAPASESSPMGILASLKKYNQRTFPKPAQ